MGLDVDSFIDLPDAVCDIADNFHLRKIDRIDRRSEEIDMNKASIKQAIVNRVESTKAAYSAWRIGLTHDPDERKQQHEDDEKSTKYWKQWVADSLSDAEDIESYFINDKGMKGGTGGNLSAHKTVYVYIF